MFYPQYYGGMNYFGGSRNYPSPSMSSQMLEPQGNMLKGRLVSSYDEAKNAMIDFDGSISYFPDLANGKIYTKQINLDGSSTTKVYLLTDPKAVEENSEFVTKQEFLKLQEQVNKIKGETNNDTAKSNESALPESYKF